MPFISLDALLGCLDGEEVGPGRFTAPNLDLDYYRVFGGQLLAQAVSLASATAEGKTVKSLACAFPREGSTEKPIVFEVGSPQTGRTFATRTVSAIQDEKHFFEALVSLHVDDEGPDAQIAAPDVGGPDDAVAEEIGMIPWECRVVGGVDLSDRAQAEPTYGFWTRLSERELPADRHVHQALLAHATDLTIIGTALRAVDGLSQADSTTKIHTAVTTHSVWFHRPFRIDEWLLIHQTGPIVANARGFGRGDVFTEDGQLVASFAQESMIRPIRQDA